MVGFEAELPSESFGRYTLLAKIATGGMGEIFLARLQSDGGISKPLVIKRILPHLAGDAEMVRMFVDEARIGAQITHPNVCQIYELGQVGVRPYIALEYLEGLPLFNLLISRARVPTMRDPRLVMALLSQACEGLHAAHELRAPDGEPAGIIHRDVNPQNIFVTSAGVVKVLDFGVAKARNTESVTRTGSVKGTYSYMSPEQLQGEPLDRRTDVFSLGIVAWEALTGRSLFKRETDMSTWQAIVEDPIPTLRSIRHDIPAALDEAVGKALARDPDQRFATARELAIALAETVRPIGGIYPPLALITFMEANFGPELRMQRRRLIDAHRAIGDSSAMPSLTSPAPAALEPPVMPAPAPAASSGRSRLRGALWMVGTAAVAVIAALVLANTSRHEGGRIERQPVSAAAVALPAAAAEHGADARRDPERPEPTPAPAPARVPAPSAVAAAEPPAPAADIDAGAPKTASAGEGAPGADASAAPAPPERERHPDPARPSHAQAAEPRPMANTPARSGFLTLAAKPYATVYVDGQEMGYTPLVKIQLPIGSHRIKLLSDERKTPEELTVTIRDGQETRRRVVW